MLCVLQLYVKELSVRLADAERTPEAQAAHAQELEGLVKDLVRGGGVDAGLQLQIQEE